MGEHYSASHFALLSAILHSESDDPKYLQHALDAFEFHRHTSADEYRFSEWMYHWDFQNYALIEAYARLQGSLSPESKQQWQACLKNWRSNARNKLSNWAAMRALALLHRHVLFGSRWDKLGFYRNKTVALKGEQKNGCLDDERGLSRPIQYHVYSAALLHRMFLLNGDPRIGQKFLKSLEFFCAFVDPDGDFNYWGRGQEQIFGYGAAIYALTAAARMTGDDQYEELARKVFAFLMGFQNEGHFPLVLNAHEDHERFGWYDYHHTTVYNAFLGAWLGLAHESQSANNGKAFAVKPELPRRKDSQFAFLKNDNFFVGVASGLAHYATEPGLTPCHLWVRNFGWVYSCPGGATAAAFGKFYGDKNSLLNFLAPIAVDQSGRLYCPAGRQGVIRHCSENQIICSLDYAAFRVNREIDLFDAEIRIQDEILFEENLDCRELRLVNFPLVVDKFQHELGKRDLLIHFENNHLLFHCDIKFSDSRLEALETAKTAKGYTRFFAMRVKDVQISKGVKFYADIQLKLGTVGSMIPGKSEFEVAST
ncbi:MAG: hypothetical protein ACE5HO_03905 [bacterium]